MTPRSCWAVFRHDENEKSPGVGQKPGLFLLRQTELDTRSSVMRFAFQLVKASRWAWFRRRTPPLYGHLATQHRTCKFLCVHGLCEQKALRQIKTHLAHSKKISRGLHPLCHSAYAVAVRKLTNPTAYRLLQWIISTASDELATNFELEEREVWQIHERRPFRSEIVDRDPDVVKTKLPGHTLCQRQATNDLDGVNLNHHSFKSGVIWHSPAQVPDRLWLLKEGHRRIDGDVQRRAR